MVIDDCNVPHGDSKLKYNAPAIFFPFVRIRDGLPDVARAIDSCAQHSVARLLESKTLNVIGVARGSAMIHDCRVISHAIRFEAIDSILSAGTAPQAANCI